MTGTLTANAMEVLQDIAGNEGAHLFSVLINLQRQEYVTAVYSCEALLLNCMFGSHLALKTLIRGRLSDRANDSLG